MADAKIGRAPINGNFKDITGQRFSRLVVIKIVPGVNGRARWLCLCDCGVEKTVSGKTLRNGQTKSCGCLKSESVSRARKTHGRAGTRVYHVWHAMHKRCNDVNNKDYRHYGGRGIRVCERWNDFKAFLDDMGERPNGLTLERRDNDKDYCPDNCYWATRRRQSNNRRNSVVLTHNGCIQTLAEWSRELGISYQTAHQRWRLGFSVDRILSKRDFREL